MKNANREIRFILYLVTMTLFVVFSAKIVNIVSGGSVVICPVTVFPSSVVGFSGLLWVLLSIVVPAARDFLVSSQ